MTWDLRLGDCLAPDGLPALPDKSVSHVICDPPYEAEAHTLQRRVKRDGGVMEVEPLDFDPMTAAVRLDVAREIARVTRRWAVVFCQVEAAMLWANALRDAGMAYKRTGVWVKPDGMPQYSGDRPGMGYESLVCAHAPGRSTWNGGGRHGVWTFCKMGEADRERSGHPTQKPVALMEALVRDFTDPGELVLDPFAGSGTTGVACRRLGRRFIGWEKSEAYWHVAQKRIASAWEQLDMFSASAPKPQQLCIGGDK